MLTIKQELQIMAACEMVLEDTHMSLCYLLSVSFGVEYEEQVSQLCHISETLKSKC